MWLQTMILITCLLVQSCSISFDGWGRKPASSANFENLIGRMQNFKSRLMGSEQEANCSKEQLDLDFKKLMSSVKRNSCAEDNFTFDREEFNQRACPKIKKPGYFDTLVRKTIDEEKNKKRVTIFQNKIDPTFIAFIKEAQGILKETGPLIYESKFEANDRAELLAKYVENILLPVRDVVVMMRSYLPKEDDGKIFYLSLQPYLSLELLQNLDQNGLGLITQGPNPAGNPFYLTISKTSNGLHQLQFSPTDIIRRDVITLLKAPTAKNYTLALKWMTLHMMMSQVFIYETLLGNKSKIPIPNSCQTHFNGNLPASFDFNFEEGVGERFLDNILVGHGLSYKDDDSSYLDYYIDNVNKNPIQEGYSALVPFENYKNALRSSEPKGSINLQPHFDDASHFQTILSFKINEAQSVFRGKLKGRTVNYAGQEIFQKMLGSFPTDELADVTIGNEVKQIYPGKQNLSPYLLELMQKNGFLDYNDLITERLKKKFVGRKVNLDFPSLYSAPVWRDWSLRYLSDTIHQYENLPPSSALYQSVKNACLMNGNRTSELRNLCATGNPLQNISNLLSEFRSGEKYVPTRRLEENKFKELYPFLGFVWILLRDRHNLLPDAKPFELNFLLDQMSAGNPWARLKFSYMVALDQLEHQQEGIIPKYDSKIFYSRNNQELMCKVNNFAIQHNNISQAGKVLGLNNPLTYNFAGKILNQKEKTQIWRNILDDIHQRNAQLFSVKSKNQTYYQVVENISYKTILTESAALNSGANLSQKAIAEIKKVSGTSEAQLGSFFLKLYQLKDPVKQQELFESFSKVNGIDSTFRLKLNFLAIDDSYKKPIYKDILKQAAHSRKLQILSELERFCKMDVNDEMEFKNIFYSTTKAQNELNQIAGLPGIPDDVMDKVNEMSSSEWRDMWWGIGSGVAGVAAAIGAVTIGGACTLASGGLCAPFAAAITVAGISSLGIQINLTGNEIERKKQADNSEREVKAMEDLGFANTGSSESVSRSYAWAAFEAITIFPLIGIAARSASLGPKILYATTRTMMRQTGERSFKVAAKSAAQEEEVRAAHYLLGFSGVAKNAGLDSKSIERATIQIAKIKKLYTSGEINLETMISKISEVLAPIKRAKLAMAKTLKGEVGSINVKQSKAMIDSKTASVISNYFADNPKEMLRLLEGYSGERLNKAVRIMGEINATDRIGNRIPVFGGVKDWFLRMRNENLALNAAKIVRIEKELARLGSKPGQLENFINKNIDDITDIFLEIPFRKREIPYFVFVQGMPEFNFFKGRKIPLLSSMSEGQTLKRVVTARARLVHESYKSQARQSLKLKRYVQAESTYKAFEAFKMSVADLANRKIGKDSARVLGEYRNLEEKIARKLHAKYKAGGEKMEFKSFKRILMNPANAQERATAEALWESVPADELMGMKEVGAFAHKAAQELSTYSDVDSFERYLSALKILIINRNPAVLEVM